MPQLRATLEHAFGAEAGAASPGSPWCRSATSTACRWTPTSWWTCGSCPTRSGSRSCASSPAATRPCATTCSAQDGAEEFIDRYLELLRLVGAGYRREGKRYLTVAVGCTGGKHRSVAISEEMARRLAGAEGGHGERRAPRPGARVTARRPGARVRAAVALGGGHGLHATLSALRAAHRRGHRRRHGRRRRRLVRAGCAASSGCCRPATCGWRWPRWPPTTPRAVAGRELVQHRFGGTGALAGHAVGQPAAGRADGGARRPGRRARRGRRAARAARAGAADELRAARHRGRGHRPRGRPEAGARIRGQVAVASTPGRVQRVWLRPERPRACPEALDAVRAADVLLLGPGSWFTSVLPHLLVPELRDALIAHPGAPGRGAQPGPGAGGDRRVLPRTAPGRTLAARPGAAGRRGDRRRRRGAGAGSAAPRRGRDARPRRPGAPGAGRRGRPC